MLSSEKEQFFSEWKKFKSLHYNYQILKAIFSVEKYNSNHKELWDKFVTTSKNATFLFHRDFMDYHHDRFMDHSLLIYKDKKLIAVFPANKVENTLHSHQGLTYGGMVLSELTKLKDVKDGFKAALLYYKERGFKTIITKQLPSIYTTVPNDEMHYLMFILEAKLIRRDTLSVLNLRHKIKFSKDRVAGNKRAKKHKLTIKEVTDFDEFWNQILIPNLVEKHDVNPVHSLDEMQLLKKNFPENVRQFNVYKDDKIVAGTTIFETEYVAHSQYISGNNEKNDLGSLDFLHTHLLENVFKDKLYFDFGISNENQGKHINEGLHYWKEGFGARTITQDFYDIDLNNIYKLDTVFI